MSRAATGAAGADADADAWKSALAGDKDEYRRLVEPFLDELRSAAARELRYRQAIGHLREQDLSAEELVGETLARAWRDRGRKPDTLDIRPWLVGLQFKVLEAIVRSERRARRLGGVSLEAPVVDETDLAEATDEAFWEWYQPDDVTRWEDVIAAEDVAPSDLDDESARGLARSERQALLLTVEHRLSLVETATVMNVSPATALRFINSAKRSLKSS